MKRKMLAFCTAGLLLTTLVVPAGAAYLHAIRDSVSSTATPAINIPKDYPEDVEGSLSFQNLESRMRQNNLTVRSLQSTLDVQKTFNRQATYDSLVDTINMMVDISWDANPMVAAQYDATTESLRAQLEPLKEENYEETLEQMTRQLQNAMAQIISGGQTLYLNILGYEASLADLERGLNTIDDTIKEMELRYALGQVPQINLEQLRATKTSTQSQKASMLLGLEKMYDSLAILVGEEGMDDLTLVGLPSASRMQESLLAMDYDTALKQAKESSYTVYAAEKARKDAIDDWEDTQKKTVSGTFSYKQAKQNYDSAMNNYDTAIKNYELSFKGLYQAVSDTEQMRKAAEDTLQYQEKTYATAKLKHQQGQISEKQLQATKDEYETALSALNQAELKAFTACHQYQLSFVQDAV